MSSYAGSPVHDIQVVNHCLVPIMMSESALSDSALSEVSLGNICLVNTCLGITTQVKVQEASQTVFARHSLQL